MGMALGSLVFTFLSIITLSLGSKTYMYNLSIYYVKYSLIAMVIGVGFTLPSLIYIKEDLSTFAKVLIHIGTGMIIYILAALYTGWIQESFGIDVLIIILIGITIAMGIGFGFYLYNKEEATKINNHLKRMKKN